MKYFSLFVLLFIVIISFPGVDIGNGIAVAAGEDIRIYKRKYYNLEGIKVVVMGGGGPVDVVGWGCNQKLVIVRKYRTVSGKIYDPISAEPGVYNLFTRMCGEHSGEELYGTIYVKRDASEGFTQLLCTKRLSRPIDSKHCGGVEI